jgi:hypothetical protein
MPRKSRLDVMSQTSLCNTSLPRLRVREHSQHKHPPRPRCPPPAPRPQHVPPQPRRSRKQEPATAFRLLPYNERGPRAIARWPRAYRSDSLASYSSAGCFPADPASALIVSHCRGALRGYCVTVIPGCDGSAQGAGCVKLSVSVFKKATICCSSLGLKPSLPTVASRFAVTSGAGQQLIFSPGSFGPSHRPKVSRVL